MKKVLGLLKKVLIAIVVLFVVAAVFGGGDEESSSSSSSQASSSQSEEQAATSEEAEADADKDEQEAADTEEEAEPEPESIEYQDVAIDDLFSALESNPLNAKTTYEDAHVRFTGVLKNIDASGDYFSLGNADEYSFSTIMCYIEDEETLNRIASSSMGDNLTVCGTITSVGEIMGYSMDVDYIE